MKELKSQNANISVKSVANRLGEKSPGASSLNSPIQRKVHFSSRFFNLTKRIGNPQTVTAINLRVKSLNSDIPSAEQKALEGLQQKNDKTPHQLEYVRNPTAANWGYCIEEQLDDYASSQGWSTQVSVKSDKVETSQKSRPDYHQKIDGIDVYVDLTSERQSGSTGPHITGKLFKAGFEKEKHIVGADITYTSTGPKQTETSVKDLKKIQKKNQKRALKELDEYVPPGEKLRKKVHTDNETT